MTRQVFNRPLLVAVALVATGCGGGSDTPSNLAARSALATAEQQVGVSPNIAFQFLRGKELAGIEQVTVTIQQKPGAVSKAVKFSFDAAYLSARGFLKADAGELKVPLIGLYSARDNVVNIAVRFGDGSSSAYSVKVTSAALTGYAQAYATPVVNRARAATDSLGFDFFYVKAGTGAPIVIDTDGEVRWSGIGTANAFASNLQGDSFFVGEQTSTGWSRLTLDGDVRTSTLQDLEAVNFHHDVAKGKQGQLVELDAKRNGVAILESVLAEVDVSGKVLKRWDMGQIFGDYMTANGDSAALFVRPGFDWFHMNSAIYDARDDSLIVSSRENFIAKLDYATGAIKWILGDPTKYWYLFPSLRAKALTLTGNGWYPVGQHALSINSRGQLMIFNNGAESFQPPAGAPVGVTRTSSVVSSYTIDSAARTATEAGRFDYGNTIYSQICSSAYDPGDGSLLVSYSMAVNGRDARLVGVSAAGQVVMDLQYPANMCKGSWNAQPIHFEDMRLTAASAQ